MRGLQVNSSISNSRQCRRILVLALGLLTAWSITLHLLPSRAVLAESNYQANLIRLARPLYATSSMPAVLIGSSITGRIIPEYFNDTSLAGAKSLGLDGSGPALALELIVNQQRPPRLLLIESNLLPVPPSANDRVLKETVSSWTL